MGENIGAAARAMWNFGCADLRLVDPRDGWPNERAVAMASGATMVLDRTRVFDTTPAAIADLTTVYATTARPRELTKRVMDPEAAAQDAMARMRDGERVGILFGRERTGLENDAIAAANIIITVPTNPVFSSLNLGQCVLLMASEIRKAAVEHRSDVYETGDSALAAQVDIERLFVHFVEELEEANYFWPEDKAAHMRLSLRNLLSRTPFTEQDVRMMRGVVRTLAERRRRKG
ncbi:MAG: RNA methyltransferase [Neomegalonema sp.]|nr:RNA methyltransferase [Neomegalonema sp.]